VTETPSAGVFAAGRRRGGDAAVTGRKDYMIGIIIAVLLAALVYWLCTALGLPAIVAIVAAILVLLAGIGTGGLGYRGRAGRV
jgi:hypothetical protein